MNPEVHIIIAFLYKRSGKKQLTESELTIPLSFELKWFTPTTAQDFIHYAQHTKLLHKKKDTYTPTFDIDTITIPVGFQPQTTTFTISDTQTTIKDNNILTKLTNKIATTTKTQPHTISTTIQHIAEEKNITPEVAAAYLAHTYNIDISTEITQIEQLLTKKTE